MIAKIEGWLEGIEDGAAMVRVGGGVGASVASRGNGEPAMGEGDGALTYQVLLSAFASGRLGGSIGQWVTLHTMYFIESHGQGATMIPRLAGFLSTEDRRFFDLFTSCKGIGNRKALRAMTVRTGQIAEAIANRDAAMLQSLPEVGRRTAETIIATLHGKVDGYLSDGTEEAVREAGDGSAGDDLGRPRITIAREALEVLTSLGENRIAASGWIDEAMRRQEQPPGDVQELLTTVFRIKGSGG